MMTEELDAAESGLLKSLLAHPNWKIIERIWNEEKESLIRRGTLIKKEDNARDAWKYLAGFLRAQEILIEKLDSVEDMNSVEG